MRLIILIAIGSTVGNMCKGNHSNFPRWTVSSLVDHPLNYVVIIAMVQGIDDVFLFRFHYFLIS